VSTVAPFPRQVEATRLQLGGLVVGAAALIACVVGAFFSRDWAQFFRAYLAAYVFFLGLGLGSLVILMVYHLTGGAWGFLLRRILEAGTRTIPILAVLFVPLAFGLVYLYEWARPEVVEVNKNIQHKAIYLNPVFFLVRAALFFVLWSGLAFILDAWSRRQDQTADPGLMSKFARLSGPGLVVYGLTLTFASVDWIMSLQTTFRSTIFGPLVASGQLLSAFALSAIVLAWLAPRPPMSEHFSELGLNDVGNLLLTFLIIWAYMVFFQFMLIWIANLPYEVIWYLPRSRGGWQWVTWVLVVFHLFIPFFLLLMRDVKRHAPTLARVAGLLLAMQLVFSYYLVLPAFPKTDISEHWMDFLTPLAIGGLWLADFLWELTRRPLLPAHDVNEEAAAHLRKLALEEEMEQAQEDDMQEATHV
jgi:hypothetical protein